MQLDPRLGVLELAGSLVRLFLLSGSRRRSRHKGLGRLFSEDVLSVMLHEDVSHLSDTRKESRQ